MSRYLGRKPTDSDYGQGDLHTIDCAQLGALDEGELTGRLVQAFRSEGYRPPRLPAVAMELLSLSQKPEVGFDQLESLLERDAVLAGEVLSAGRSAHYGGRRPVDSLHEALVRLGLNGIREVVMQAAMSMRVFRSTTYRDCMERLRDHCRATAHLSRLVSRYSSVAEERAFLCGLLHDVGIAGILLVLGDATQPNRSAPELELVWPAIDAVHAEAGARMVELWGLPVEISLAVGAHHRVTIEGADHPLAATACIAEAIAGEVGLALVPQEQAEESGERWVVDLSDSPTIERALRALSIADTTLELIRNDATAWAAALHDDSPVA